VGGSNQEAGNLIRYVPLPPFANANWLMPRQAGLDTPGTLHHIMIRVRQSGRDARDAGRCEP
jgi:hypothetical protein